MMATKVRERLVHVTPDIKEFASYIARFRFLILYPQHQGSMTAGKGWC